MATAYQLEDALDGMAVTFTKRATGGSRVRLGRLEIPRRKTMETPHHLGVTSRGVIPHLSQDMLVQKTSVQGVYVALEDFIEKAASNKIPPVLDPTILVFNDPLREFIALPEDYILVLGARRSPPVTSPWSNTQTAISIYTSVGFGRLESEDFANAARKLNPDIVIGLGDIPSGDKPGSRRMEKMSSRTEQFMRRIMPEEESEELNMLRGKLFAPILPIEKEQQTFYLDLLVDEWKDRLSGLAIYDASSAADLPEELDDLPRLSLSNPKTPHDLLREISLGVDIFTVPFIGAATDAGIALDFRFPPPSGEDTSQAPLGLDMWLSEHADSAEPLVQGCECFACIRHHRAYLQHLLSAKEMLAWVLLQIHNLRILDQLFAGIRHSIAGDNFETDVEAFRKKYETQMPEKTGSGPRVRGYQYKSEGPGETKKNPAPFKMMHDREAQNSGAPTPNPHAQADDLIEQGFAKPGET